MHRDPAADRDHAPAFGHLATPEELTEVEHQLDLPRRRMAVVNGVEQEVVYTTRDWKSKKKPKGDESVENEDAIPDWDGVIPAPEVTADHGVVPWPLRQSVPNGVWLVLKPALAVGLEVVRLTYARGTWLRADGQRPGVSETWVLAVRAAELDSGPWAAVGCWRNAGGKWGYDHGLLISGKRGEFVSAAAIKQWIKDFAKDPTPDIEEAHRG